MFHLNKKTKRKIFKKIKIGFFLISFLFTSLLSYLPYFSINGARVVEAAPGTRVRTVEFFAGQYASATLANAGAQNNFTAQNVEIAETSVDIIDSYIEFSAQVGANAAVTISEGLLYFSACNTTSCTPATPVMIMNTASFGTHSGESQTVRLRADVSSNATLASFTGGTFAFQVGYCIDGASGTDAGTCNGTVADSIQSANAKLVTTYTYDETSTIQTNTVIYPLESNTTGPIGSRTAVQASCTMDSNCPKFSYNANIPELSSQVSQFFHTQFFNGPVSGVVDTELQTQIEGNTSGSTMYFEQALQVNGGAMNYLVNGLTGYANNTAQQLESRVNNNATILGGENYVTYKYPNSAGTKTKTIILPIGEVQTVGSTTKSQLVGSTVHFPETGVNVEKAWFRVHTSVGGQITASNLGLTTKVGSNAESGITNYSITGANQGVSDDGYFIHIIPSVDYTHLETANADTGVSVSMSADWATPRGAVSGELVITYTYTGDTDGFNTTQRLFAGQSNSAETTFSAPNGEIDPYINAGTGSAVILGVSLKMDGKDTSATANQSVGVNMTSSPNACVATNTSTTLTDTEITKVTLFKKIIGVVTNNDATAYTPCYSSNQSTIFNGTVAITTMIDLRVASPITISGTCNLYNKTSSCSDIGEIKVAVNGVLNTLNTQPTVSLNWSITGFPKPNFGDSVIIFIDGASATDRAVAVTKYDGTGNIDMVKLYQEHVTIGTETGSQNVDALITISDMDDYDATTDSDVFYDVLSSGLCEGVSSYTGLCIDGSDTSSQEKLIILPNTIFAPGGNIRTHDIEIVGTFIGSAHTYTVSGSWFNTGTFDPTTCIVKLISTTSETISNSGSTFYDLTLNGSGGSWAMQSVTTVNRNLIITAGTLNLGAYNFNVAGSSSISGTLTTTSATATKTFTGAVTINSGGKFDLFTASSFATASVFSAGITNNSNVTDSFRTGSGTTTLVGNLAGTGTGGINFKGALTISSGTTTNNYTGGEVTVNGTLTLTGALTQGINSTFNYVSSNAIAGVGVLNASTNANIFGYIGTAQTCKIVTYYNLNLSNSGVKTCAVVAINGNFNVNGTASFTTASNISVTGITTVGIGASITNGGTYTFVSPQIVVEGTGIFTNNGIISISNSLSGTGTFVNGATGTLNLNFNSVPSINTLNATAAGNTVVYKGTAPSIKGITYHHLDVKTSGIATLDNIINVNGIFTLTQGTFNTNNYDLNINNFFSSNTNTRSIVMGSSIWDITGTGTVWDVSISTGLTIVPGTSTIKITNSGSSGKIFAGGDNIYGNLWLAPKTGTGPFTILGSNTFLDFKDDGTVAHTILFTKGTTQTIYSWAVTGTIDNLITLDSTTTDSYNLVLAGVGTYVESDYLNIQHSIATPKTDTWYAGDHSVNNQDINTAGSGWIFTSRPIVPVSINQSAFRFFENLDNSEVGDALSLQDTSYNLNHSGDNFRLRSLLHINDSHLLPNEINFKLQYAEKSGTCDIDFLGETYYDVTNDTDISYFDNFFPDDKVVLTSNIDDPIHGSDVIVNQTYVESNNFTNSISAVSVGQDGLWDFSLYDRTVNNNASYCFRIVKADGNILDGYSVIPEIITAQYKSRGGGSRYIEKNQCSDDLDNDEDTYIDGDDPNCHLGGSLLNSYIPDWNSEIIYPEIFDGGSSDGGLEVYECNDGLDNDEDSLIDETDPQCHMEGLLQNEYKPEWNSETTAPVSVIPCEGSGCNGGGGGDLGYLFDKNYLIFYLMNHPIFRNSLLSLALFSFN